MYAERDGEQLLFRGLHVAANYLKDHTSNICRMVKEERGSVKGYSVSYVSLDDLHKYSHLLIIDE